MTPCLDPAEWLRCQHWIEPALEYTRGTHTIDDITSGIASGQFQFWPGKNAAIVTEIYEYPRLKALNFFLLGGDGDEIFERLRPVVEAWAANEMGCTRFFGVGRMGMKLRSRPHGYEPAWIVMVKEI